MFQSTPCTEVQGDSRTLESSPQQKCFNPLPAPKYREIFSDINVQWDPRVFQSTPCTEVQGDQRAACQQSIS